MENIQYAQPTLLATGKAMHRTGIVLSALPTLFLLMDGVMKLVKPAAVVTGTTDLGYNENVIVPLGVLLTLITILYAIPRTAVVGAILITAYLGGAVATHVRVGAPAFNIIFPVVFGIMIWGGLYLRDARLRSLLAARQ